MKVSGWMLGVLGIAALGCGKEPEPVRRPATAPVVREQPREQVAPGTALFVQPGERLDDAPLDKRGEGALPDGTFTGALRGEGVSGEVELTVAGGVLTSARAQLAGEPGLELPIAPVRLPDDPELFLVGRQGGDMVKMQGRFVEGERASGEFEATVGRKGLSGRWYAVRR